MLSVGKWRWPLIIALSCAATALPFLLGQSQWVYETYATLSAKGGKTIRLPGEGSTPARAVAATQTAVLAYQNNSVSKQKSDLQQKMATWEKKDAVLHAQVDRLIKENQQALKGVRGQWTPESEKRLNELSSRYHWLKEGYPTHTDIPVLARQISSLEAQKRGGRVTVDRARLSELSHQINEARIGFSLTERKVKELGDAKKQLRSTWKITQVAQVPQWPVRLSGWPWVAGTALGTFILGLFLFKRGKQTQLAKSTTGNGLFRTVPLTVISPDREDREIAVESQENLPDDPLSRKAAGLFDQWLVLVNELYTPSPEPPQGLLDRVEPLLKDTADFLPEGQDVLARYVARAVNPGDLSSHVVRTVLMALMGAHEAGASVVEQKAMTLAALFHDLAVVPRRGDSWYDVGPEVGRLSSDLIQKLSGFSPALMASIEAILIGMDEYPQEMWQNVARQKDVDSFAKLLRQIDRFDKVLQKQKARVTRRLNEHIA